MNGFLARKIPRSEIARNFGIRRTNHRDSVTRPIFLS